MLDTVPNPHPGHLYAVRFTCPEFTSLCPITGQPDFAHLVIDYVPEAVDSRKQVAEAVSRLVPQPRRVSRGLHARRSRAGSSRRWRRAGCASAAIGIRAAASRSTCSTRPASRPPGCGCPIPASPPIAAAAERRDDRPRSARRSATRHWRSGFDAVGFAAAHLGRGGARRSRANIIARGYHGDMGWLAEHRGAARRPADAVARGAHRRRARRQLRRPRTIRWPAPDDPERGVDLGLCPRPRLPRHDQEAPLKALAHWIDAALAGRR